MTNVSVGEREERSDGVETLPSNSHLAWQMTGGRQQSLSFHWRFKT